LNYNLAGDIPATENSDVVGAGFGIHPDSLGFGAEQPRDSDSQQNASGSKPPPFQHLHICFLTAYFLLNWNL
jgi:hypothetical protein